MCVWGEKMHSSSSREVYTYNLINYTSLTTRFRRLQPHIDGCLGLSWFIPATQYWVALAVGCIKYKFAFFVAISWMKLPCELRSCYSRTQYIILWTWVKNKPRKKLIVRWVYHLCIIQSFFVVLVMVYSPNDPQLYLASYHEFNLKIINACVFVDCLVSS